MYKTLIVTFIMLLMVGLSFGQTYVGSDSCIACHSSESNDWAASGHPYKFTITDGDVAPTYPAEAINFQNSWMDSLGDGSHTWNDIAGVIGGYGWKARFVGTDGHLIGTKGSSFPDSGGGHNQFNFFGGEEHGWVNYHPNDVKIYNYGCFKCHTTGGDTNGTWLDGVDGLGNFSEGGVGCESCHGPGSAHVVSMSKDDIDRVYEFAHQDNAIGGLDYGDGNIVTPDGESNDITFLCGTCHNRSYTSPINSKGGFIKHHEQWDEFIATSHFSSGFTCITCHDPHKRVIWDGSGIKTTCETCHSAQAATTNHAPGANLDCIDCHMPFAAKSGTTRGQSGFKGDVRSHLFKILPDSASIFTEDGSAVKDDLERSAAMNAQFACLGCHNDNDADGIANKTVAQAVTGAANMHIAVAIDEPTSAVPVDYALNQNFPNPFNPQTSIVFSLSEQTNVELFVYNVNGQIVETLVSQDMSLGIHEVKFNGGSFPSGIYFYVLKTQNYTQTRKMILMK